MKSLAFLMKHNIVKFTCCFLKLAKYFVFCLSEDNNNNKSLIHHRRDRTHPTSLCLAVMSKAAVRNAADAVEPDEVMPAATTVEPVEGLPEGQDESKSSAKLVAGSKRTYSFVQAADYRPDWAQKLLKSGKPDLTIVVGGVEFHHYKQILCAACPFIDAMLSTNMKESQENMIEFAEKDPDLWIIIAKLLDPYGCSKERKDDLLKSVLIGSTDSILKPPLLTEDQFLTMEALELVKFLDYLGVESWVQHFCDIALWHYLKLNRSGDLNTTYSTWSSCQEWPCPRLKKKLIFAFKEQMLRMAYDLSHGQAVIPGVFDSTKDFLFDEECGKEIWMHLVVHVDFPDEMTENASKEAIVNSPLVKYMLEMAGRPLTLERLKNIRMQLQYDE
jgi:hypothetical protein